MMTRQARRMAATPRKTLTASISTSTMEADSRYSRQIAPTLAP